MVYRVVATKLTEEEHAKLLDTCNKHGCTPSSLIKEGILKMINEEKPEETELSKLAKMLKKENESKDLSTSELREYLGLKKN